MSPGWYDDPQAYGWLRYWDGQQWTRDTAPRPAGYTGPNPAATEVAPASFLARLGAFIIDMLILAVPLDLLITSIWLVGNWDTVISFMNQFESGDAQALGRLIEAETGPAIWFNLALAATWFIYEYFMLTKKSATLGMLLLRIEVQSAAGAAVSKPGALIRAAVFSVVMVSGLVPGIGVVLQVAFVIDCLSMHWNRRGQTWHDKAAETIVVKKTSSIATHASP